MGLSLNGVISFEEIEKPGKSYFNFYPDDWKEVLFNQWDKLGEAFSVYSLQVEKENAVVGILFKDHLPELSELEQRAVGEFQGFSYIGFLYTMPEFRGCGLGSKWLQLLRQFYPHAKFWLAIEELELEKFYLKNGFSVWKGNPEHSSEKVLYWVPPRSSSTALSC